MPIPIDYRVSRLSANQFNQMIEAKAIFTSEDRPLKKYKVKNGDVVLISKERMQNIYVKKETL